jgi:hypothetical protein
MRACVSVCGEYVTGSKISVGQGEYEGNNSIKERFAEVGIGDKRA